MRMERMRNFIKGLLSGRTGPLGKLKRLNCTARRKPQQFEASICRAHGCRRFLLDGGYFALARNECVISGDFWNTEFAVYRRLRSRRSLRRIPSAVSDEL